MHMKKFSRIRVNTFHLLKKSQQMTVLKNKKLFSCFFSSFFASCKRLLSTRKEVPSSLKWEQYSIVSIINDFYCAVGYFWCRYYDKKQWANITRLIVPYIYYYKNNHRIILLLKSNLFFVFGCEIILMKKKISLWIVTIYEATLTRHKSFRVYSHAFN